MTETPRNIDAEKAILGAALVPFSQKEMSKMAVLTEDSFSDHLHKKIWRGIISLLRAGKRPDPLLLKEELGDIPLTDLLRLTEQACLESSVQHYVEILRDKERGRRLFYAANNALNKLKDGCDYEEIETTLVNSLSKQTAAEQTTTIEGDVDALLRGEDVQNWVTFGLPEIDSTVGGLRPGEVCILAARTSVGKSAGAIASTVRSAETGWNPLYMSYEMAKRQLWYRMLSYHSGVSLRKFRDSLFNEYDRRKIKEAQKDLGPVFQKIKVNTEANT
ncbi:MAG: DnaB-like helicase C-terminal domain-containing protein, partial [Candidatus Omnitrophica bacterium]|nr:DnaB-like helicase C-terminal domain-containing protein [Candidatus Omnitrophota bacterium]